MIEFQSTSYASDLTVPLVPACQRAEGGAVVADGGGGLHGADRAEAKRWHPVLKHRTRTQYPRGDPHDHDNRYWHSGSGLVQRLDNPR